MVVEYVGLQVVSMDSIIIGGVFRLKTLIPCCHYRMLFKQMSTFSHLPSIFPLGFIESLHVSSCHPSHMPNISPPKLFLLQWTELGVRFPSCFFFLYNFVAFCLPLSPLSGIYLSIVRHRDTKRGPVPHLASAALEMYVIGGS